MVYCSTDAFEGYFHPRFMRPFHGGYPDGGFSSSSNSELKQEDCTASTGDCDMGDDTATTSPSSTTSFEIKNVIKKIGSAVSIAGSTVVSTASTALSTLKRRNHVEDDTSSLSSGGISDSFGQEPSYEFGQEPTLKKRRMS